MFGSHRAKVIIPEIYEIEMTRYLDSIKKEKTGAKKNGELNEKETNPIRVVLWLVLGARPS